MCLFVGKGWRNMRWEKSKRWCHGPGESLQLFFPSISPSWLLTFSTGALISSAIPLQQGLWWQSHAKHHTAGQPNNKKKTCPLCRVHPMRRSSCSWTVEGLKVTNYLYGWGYGPLNLAKWSEFVCSPRKFFMGRLNSGVMPQVPLNIGSLFKAHYSHSMGKQGKSQLNLVVLFQLWLVSFDM